MSPALRTNRVPDLAPGCPGCLGSKARRRLVCLACEQVLPPAMAAELARTAGRALTDPVRAAAAAEALTWLRVRRENRGH